MVVVVVEVVARRSRAEPGWLLADTKSAPDSRCRPCPLSIHPCTKATIESEPQTIEENGLKREKSSPGLLRLSLNKFAPVAAGLFILSTR